MSGLGFPKQSDKLDIKNVHQTLWKCRDFELTSLWQRSIFLTTLLVLCYTGYGFIFSAIVNKQETSIILINSTEKSPYNQDSNNLMILHVSAIFISIVGILFSCLWIAMAKGSKAWYERYEKTIFEFEMDCRNIKERAKHYATFQGYDNMVKEEHIATVNSSLFSMNGGAYSPSKINIAIGQISAIIYLILCIIHIVIIFSMQHLFKIKNILNSKDILFNLFIIIIPIAIIILLLIWHNGWIKSSSMNDEEYRLDFIPIDIKDNNESKKKEIDRLKSNYYYAYTRTLKFIKEAPDGTIILAANKNTLKVTSALFNMMTYLIYEQNALYKKNKKENGITNDTIKPIANFIVKKHDNISIEELNDLYNKANKWFY